MKGFVPTPDKTVDLMVSKLFHKRQPRPSSRLLDPGCGTGAFIAGVIRWCEKRKLPLPRMIGVESDPRHIPEAEERFLQHKSVKIVKSDFLLTSPERFDFVIGNPPYVPITRLNEQEKRQYRSLFETARGRFDLYILFFEQALRSLEEDGHLVLITPEKFVYVDTAAPLRRLLSQRQVEEIHFVDEDTFGELVTYPTITTVVNQHPSHATKVILRESREEVSVEFPSDGSSWLPAIRQPEPSRGSGTLEEISMRISCGVATGADEIYVRKSDSLSGELKPFAYETVSGRQLVPGTPDFVTDLCMLVPYGRNGRLLEETELSRLHEYLSRPENVAVLKKRTCVKRKPWYAFHETPPLPEILKPKLLCKDITEEPQFWMDKKGTIVPRHSVYYVIPKDPARLEDIHRYLNSEEARAWLMANCQRAANGFIRLQSNVLKRLPVPSELTCGEKDQRGQPPQTPPGTSSKPRRTVP